MSVAAMLSTLSSTLPIWATMSTWPNPTELSHDWSGATICGRSWRICGMDATNWVMDVARAWAAIRTLKTREVARDPVHERADDEGEQPRQEEREEHVAEEEDRLPEQADGDEEQHD